MTQYIVSLDFSHLVFMFRPHAGSSFKQDDVWRMQLNGSYRNRGLNLRFLFITGTMENKSLFLVLPLLLGGGHTVCCTCVYVSVLFGQMWSLQRTRAGVFWIRTDNLVFPEQYADVRMSFFFLWKSSRFHVRNVAWSVKWFHKARGEEVHLIHNYSTSDARCTFNRSVSFIPSAVWMPKRRGTLHSSKLMRN